MSSWKWLLLVCGTISVVAGVWTSPAAQSVAGAGIIQGNIKSADGTPMEGVIVSARASDESFTTSVFTDQQGNYTFPPVDAGQYSMWAQAVGFSAGRSEFAVERAETERFTEYFLPTRGTEIRHVQVDNSTGTPTTWAPYNRTNKIVRLQFRTAASQ